MAQYSPHSFLREDILDYIRSCERLVATASTAAPPWSDRELQMIEAYVLEVCHAFAPLMKDRTHSIVRELARREDPQRMSKQ